MGQEVITKCLTCGGELKPNARTGIPTCVYCGRAYRSGAESCSAELADITNRRQIREFIKAEELCKALLEKQPESSEASWQALLSSLGVVYVKEKETGETKPTFFSYTYDERISVLENPYYTNALKYAPSEEDRNYYEEKGRELDALLKEFFELVAKETSYDIFISFKMSEQVTRADGEVRTVYTDDYEKAREIYEHLKGKYRVFFSPESIGKDHEIEGKKYEPRILKALQTSQAMILLGSKKEYLEAQWVENEWKRYLYYMDKGKKNKVSLIYVYNHSFPVLPPALAEKQLPSVDMFKGDMFSQLESKLSFVKSSKGLASKIKKRTVQTDFTNDATGFEYSGTRERVVIGGKGGSEIQISAGEERALQSARNQRNHSSFKNAMIEYDNVLRMNQNNAEAHWGRFLCMVKCSLEDKLPDTIFKAKSIPFAEFHRAIECSNDEQFSWACVDAMLACLDADEKWAKIQPLYDEILKYLDDKRVDVALTSLLRRCCFNAETSPKESESVFAQARRLFSEENRMQCLSVMRKYANTLRRCGHYDLAQKYYEELASAERQGKDYLHLLECRLKTDEIERTAFSLEATPAEDAATKHLSELTPAEIIERIIICDYKKQNSAAMGSLERMVKYQVSYNKKAAKIFVETVVGTYDALGEEERVNAFLMELAELCVAERDYKNAEVYFKEYLARDETSAQAHWGLLKCHMKADSDLALLKRHNKLYDMQDFQNAKNCASDFQYEYYMSIGNGDSRVLAVEAELMRTLKYRNKGEGVEIIGGVREALSRRSDCDFTVPSHVDGKRVVGIGAEAFQGCKTLRSVTIPDTVTHIGFRAFFDCTNLVSVTVPGSVRSIGNEAFAYCRKLATVNIPKNVRNLGLNVFSSCENLLYVTVGDSTCSPDDLNHRMAAAGERNRTSEEKARKRYVRGRVVRSCIFFLPAVLAVLIGIDVFTKSHGLMDKINATGGLSVGLARFFYIVFCIAAVGTALGLNYGMSSNETYESYVKQNKKQYGKAAVLVALLSLVIVSLNLSQAIPNLVSKNKVRFECEDGTIAMEYVNKGERLKLPADTKADSSQNDYIVKYVFEGWMIDGELYREGQWYTPDHWVTAVPQFSEEQWCTLKISESYAQVMLEFESEALKSQWKTDGTLPLGTRVTASATFSYSDVSGQSFSVNGNSVSNPYTFTLNKNTTVSASSWDTSCLAEGTRIMLADGTTKAVEELQTGDILLVFNHETGRYEASPILVNVHAGEEAALRDVVNLSFSDGGELRIVGEHGLFDRDLNQYVYINADNADGFVGHRFVSVAYENGEAVSRTVVLNEVTVTNEFMKVYNPASVWHINLIADRMLTLSAGMVNLFAYDENMKYDEALMAADIAEWGLYTYDDFKDYIPLEVFNAFPFRYYKVAVGKGLITFKEVLWLIGFYNDPASLK